MTNWRTTMWIGIAMFLFLLQELPLFKARWVEDESWYTIPAYTLLQEGHLRNPTSEIGRASCREKV